MNNGILVKVFLLANALTQRVTALEKTGGSTRKKNPTLA